MSLRKRGERFGEVDHPLVSVQAAQIEEQNGFVWHTERGPYAGSRHAVRAKPPDVHSANRAVRKHRGFGRRHNPIRDQILALRRAVDQHVRSEPHDKTVDCAQYFSCGPLARCPYLTGKGMYPHRYPNDPRRHHREQAGFGGD